MGTLSEAIALPGHWCCGYRWAQTVGLFDFRFGETHTHSWEPIHTPNQSKRIETFYFLTCMVCLLASKNVCVSSPEIKGVKTYLRFPKPNHEMEEYPILPTPCHGSNKQDENRFEKRFQFRYNTQLGWVFVGYTVQRSSSIVTCSYKKNSLTSSTGHT